MQDHSLFVYSFLQHQQLVDIIRDNSDIDGVCRLSQSEMAAKLGKTQAWVHKAIAKINTEDVCITYKQCFYRAAYYDLSKHGVYSKIIHLMQEVFNGKGEFIFTAKDKDIAEKYGIKVKTLQMFRAFLIKDFANVPDSADEAYVEWFKKLKEHTSLIYNGLEALNSK